MAAGGPKQYPAGEDFPEFSSLLTWRLATVQAAAAPSAGVTQRLVSSGLSLGWARSMRETYTIALWVCGVGLTGVGAVLRQVWTERRDACLLSMVPPYGVLRGAVQGAEFLTFW